jgi:hypothetical protein
VAKGAKQPDRSLATSQQPLKGLFDHFWPCQRGRKVFSLGVWTPTANIEAIRQHLFVHRKTR